MTSYAYMLPLISKEKKREEIGILHDELILFFQKVWRETYVFSLSSFLCIVVSQEADFQEGGWEAWS